MFVGYSTPTRTPRYESLIHIHMQMNSILFVVLESSSRTFGEKFTDVVACPAYFAKEVVKSSLNKEYHPNRRTCTGYCRRRNALDTEDSKGRVVSMNTRDTFEPSLNSLRYVFRPVRMDKATLKVLVNLSLRWNQLSNTSFLWSDANVIKIFIATLSTCFASDSQTLAQVFAEAHKNPSLKLLLRSLEWVAIGTGL